MKTFLRTKIHQFSMKKRSSELFWLKTGLLSVSLAVSAMLMSAELSLLRARKAAFFNFRAATLQDVSTKGSSALLGPDTPVMHFAKDKVLVSTVYNLSAAEPNKLMIQVSREKWRNEIESKKSNANLSTALKSHVIALSFEEAETIADVMSLEMQVAAIAQSHGGKRPELVHVRLASLPKSLEEGH